MTSLLITHDYPPNIGGIATVLSRLWEIIGSEETLILAPAVPGWRAVDMYHAARTYRYPVFHGDSNATKAINMLTAGLWLIGILLYHKPTVIVAGQATRAGIPAFLWNRLTGTPYFLWIYGGETSHKFIYPAAVNRFVHRVLRGATVLFTIGSYTTRQVKQFGIPEDRIVELKMGIDGRNFEPEGKNPVYVQRYGLDGKLVFLTLGRLIARKGVDLMLRALSEMASELPPWHYLIVSDGPYRSHLEALAENLGLADNVSFTGKVAMEELCVYYNLCDIFVMPNRSVAGNRLTTRSVEGFGIVLVEAAACGKPVIAGKSGGTLDALHDGYSGILVNSESSDELKAAIRSLLDPDRRRQMGENGIEFAAQFEWFETAKRLSQAIGRQKS